MNRRPTIALLVALTAGALFVCGLPILAIITPEPNAAACTGPASSGQPAAISTAGVPAVGTWTTEQTTNAAIIVAVGQDRKIPARGWVVAVATAMQESDLHNLGNLGSHNDHDSLGLFQQRPTAGWGTPEQILDPHYAAGKFYDKLVKVPDWDKIPLDQAAQAVQRSAFPDSYATHEQAAEQIVAAVARVANIHDLTGASIINCGTPGAISSGGWTQPVKAPILSGFRTPERPNHYGVDLGAPRYTAIRAAARGTIIRVVCNSTIGTCDQDGGSDVGGCGWYVEIRHTDNIVTRYCHMARHPDVHEGQAVNAGDVIGAVGSSGNSSGPHLHFEVHTNITTGGGYVGNDNAVDPVNWMKNAGAPLGIP